MDSNKNKEKMYIAQKYYMIRTPLLKKEIYNKIFDLNEGDDDFIQDVMNVIKMNAVKEAISTSSLALGEAIERFIQSGEKLNMNDKKDKKFFSSLIKYLGRMTTRTTPYGMFSGVALGSFGDKSDVRVSDISQHKKRARPDMEWIYLVVKKIEQDSLILDKLSVRINKLALKKGNRLDNPYVTNYGKVNYEDLNMTASIKYTKQVENVYNLCGDWIQFKDLVDKIVSINNGVPETVVRKFLKSLLDNEFLISNIRPVLTLESQIESLVKKIEKADLKDNFYSKLLEINDLIGKYNNMKIGEGGECYYNIIEKMKSICKCKSYLQIDLNIKMDQFKINKTIAEDLEKSLEVLARISFGKSQNHVIEKYKEEFIGKYGQDREVNLIELLDNDIGLGAPAGYGMPPSSRIISPVAKSASEVEFEEWLDESIIKALKLRQKEIDIDEYDLKRIEDDKISKDIKWKLPTSLEVNAIVAAKSDEDIDKGNYKIYIGPNIGSISAGKTFGRFSDIIGKEINELFKDILKEEKKFYSDDEIFAELTELPQNGRITNITLNNNAYEYEINIGSNANRNKKQIHINDIYIGIDKKKNKFYIKSKSLNKKIIIKSTHMLTSTYGSNIYRFLRDISGNSFEFPLQIISRLKMNNKFYVPRIVYKNIVLCPKTWLLSLKSLGLDDKVTESEFQKALNVWRRDFDLDKYVYLTEFDNRLLLNLDNKFHINELYTAIKKKDLIITEIEEGLDYLWVKGNNGKYFSEIVIPFVLNKDKFNDKDKSINSIQYKGLETKCEYTKNRSNIGTYDAKRLIPLGKEWIYFKLYVNKKRTDELIADYVVPFFNDLVAKKYIEEYFFIRYADPKDHIRLRIKIFDKKSIVSLMDLVNEFFNDLKIKGLVTAVNIDTYDREIERYGGIEIFDYVEKYFFRDSVFVGEVIKNIRLGRIKMNMESIVEASLINIMECFGVNYNAQLKLFDNIIRKDIYREEFNENRRQYLSIVDTSNNNANLRGMDGGNILYELFNIRKESIIKYKRAIDRSDDNNLLTNNKTDIMLSIMHMNCNRILNKYGMELEIMSIIRHSLYAARYLVNKKREKSII